MHKNDEYLFDDEERSELEDKDYMKDPSLDDLFPDKKDVDIDRLLRNYEEKFQENDMQKEVKNDEKNNDRKIAKKEKVKMKTWQKIVVVIICVALTCGSGLGFLLYGPYPNFREWLITTAMTTMRHQYLAKWFYSQKTIDAVLKNNYVKSVDEDTDLNAITFVDYSKSKGMYKNKYEKEILSHEDGEKYKLININSDGMRGYLVAIYDASKVKVGTATNLNVKGEMLTTIAKNNKAIVAMNASGFNDPGYMGNGSKPHGVVIQNGRVVSNNGNVPVSGGVLGFTKDNKFIMKKMTAQQALEKGIRDAVEFGPYSTDWNI